MSRLTAIFLLVAFFFGNPANAQYKAEFDGQVSSVFGFGPDNKPQLFLGGRYLPRLSLSKVVDSTKLLDIELSANANGSLSTLPFDTLVDRGQLTPYRAWVRYSGPQFELRAGLQKIDFGSAMLLRPIQWFNQIDPRDPLQLTNGVYGLLGKYYFLNNANIWLWGLYGNEKTRGFDVVKTRKDIPEYGGRFQYPIGPGELAVTYHHRVAESKDLLVYPSFNQIPEDRIGLDGKWDVGIGLWFEATYSYKQKGLNALVGLDLPSLTHQSMFNVGADYTFAIGNGMNVITEHFLISYDSRAFEFQNPGQLTALMINYPLGLYDQLAVMTYMNWANNDPIFLLNFQHQFKYLSSYILAYYNPESAQGIQENDLVNTFSGPGIRLMLVYNH